jgi:hypothetical protein
MGLRKVFEEAMPDVFNTAGEDAVFIPQGGIPIPCKMFIDFDVALQPEGIQSETWDRGITIELLLSEVKYEPKRGDKIIYVDKGKTYSLVTPLENDNISIIMVAKEEQ